MAVQRKSQIPKAPERSLVDSIVTAPTKAADPAPSPALTLAPEPSPRAEPRPEPAREAAQPQALRAPAKRQRKPNRITYTSKMDPELKAWAMSYKTEGEDFVEVVEQALWVLRLARSGQMDDAVTALEQATQPIEE